MPAFRTVLLLTVLLLAACARTDLGAPCHVQNATGAELDPLPGRQYLYLGSSECASWCQVNIGAGWFGWPCWSVPFSTVALRNHSSARG